MNAQTIPTTISYVYPGEGNVKMIYCPNKKYYQIYLNGELVRRQPASDIIKSLDKFSADTVFTYA